MDPVTLANVQAAAAEEKIHYQTLISDAVGAKPVTKRIRVPDEVFSSAQNFLTTLVVGDQVFINAYLLAGTVFARAGGVSGSKFARYAAEFMGVEAVHRALALQSLGRLGNDRVVHEVRAEGERQRPADDRQRGASSRSPTPSRCSRPRASASARRARRPVPSTTTTPWPLARPSR